MKRDNVTGDKLWKRGDFNTIIVLNGKHLYRFRLQLG